MDDDHTEDPGVDLMIRELILFTNRNCMGFDENGKQMMQIHNAISYSHVNKGLARLAINTAEHCFLSKFREWKHEISKDEMRCLLGLMDDQDVEQCL